jgi:hypothetical protein
MIGALIGRQDQALLVEGLKDHRLAQAQSMEGWLRLPRERVGVVGAEVAMPAIRKS